MYLDAVSFVHKRNRCEDALAPAARVWRTPAEGLELTAKGSKDVGGGNICHFIVGISFGAGAVVRTLRSDNGNGDENQLISSPFSLRLCEEVLYEMNATGTYHIGLNWCICQINNASNQKDQNQPGDRHGIAHQEGIVDDTEFVSVRSKRIQESAFILL